MKSPVSASSLCLVILGSLAIFLIGAFARFDSPPTAALSPFAPAPDNTLEAAGSPALPADFSPGLAEIIKLAQAHVDESVLLSFIQNSGQTYSPSADEILYLADLGISQNIIAALFKGNPPALPAPTALAAAPEMKSNDIPMAPHPAPEVAFFHDDLAKYGSWTQVPDYGLCWQPTVETLQPDWQPYVNQGQWLSTDDGWYWQSDYSWGWAAFHYGRWLKEARLGWVWVPDRVWGPAWVSWRTQSSYIGWAPLPPGVGLNIAANLLPQRTVPSAKFTFVPTAHFFNHNPTAPVASTPVQIASKIAPVRQELALATENTVPPPAMPVPERDVSTQLPTPPANSSIGQLIFPTTPAPRPISISPETFERTTYAPRREFFHHYEEAERARVSDRSIEEARYLNRVESSRPSAEAHPALAASSSSKSTK